MSFKPYEHKFKALKMVTSFKDLKEFEEAKSLINQELKIPFLIINAGEEFQITRVMN